MKQFKLFAIALTLLMGISFTSCLNNDGESTYDIAGYARVQNSYYGVQLKGLDGTVFIPTASSLAAMKQQGVDLASSEYDLVYVYLKWVEQNQTQQKAASSTRSVELVAVNALKKGSFDYVTSMEELATQKEAPVVTLTPNAGSYYGQTASPWLYGPELVVLPIQWRMENKEEALKQHTFRLHYVEGVSDNENKQGNKTLALYLIHDKGTDAAKNEGLVNAAFNYTFDIQTILEQYKRQNGAYPVKVVIKAKCANDGFTMPKPSGDDLESVWTTFEIDSSLLNQPQK